MTQHESDFDVLRQQPSAFVVGSSGKLSSPIGPETRITEVELNLDFRLQYQNFTHAKVLRMAMPGGADFDDTFLRVVLGLPMIKSPFSRHLNFRDRFCLAHLGNQN